MQTGSLERLTTAEGGPRHGAVRRACRTQDALGYRRGEKGTRFLYASHRTGLPGTALDSACDPGYHSWHLPSPQKVLLWKVTDTSAVQYGTKTHVWLLRCAVGANSHQILKI